MTQVLPCSASVSLAPVLTGPVRAVPVTASLSRALYVDTLDPEIPALCLTAADAVRVPCALVLGPGVAVPTAAVGSTAWVGEGRIRLASGASAAVTRWWRPSRPQVHLLHADARQRALRELAASPNGPAGEFDPAIQELAAQLATALTDATGSTGSTGAADGVRALLGRGDGLTPLGDDVLAGALVTLNAASHPAAHVLGSMVSGELAARPGIATTPVSAALLAHAARGECIPELAAVLTDSAARLEPAISALLRVGHSSGFGLLLGVDLALSVLTGPTHALHPTGRMAE
ncbi:DUF2877 domain-containing protein [Cryptosporangium minutisporangium]|uniref:DUF2877 domain-containing protein n=1 Tax=Cryptosporangium minutisporangium TaxID=113569 RepID=A0ABP6SWR2_9ACTN